MDWWVTPSGTTVSVEGIPEYTRSGHMAVFVDLTVSSTGGAARPVTVQLDEPGYVNTLRAGNGLAPLSQEDRAGAARIAAIRAVDVDSDFFGGSEPVQVALGYAELDESQPVDRISDRPLRRYIARRLYLLWEHESFDPFLRFGSTDAALTGAESAAFLRNLQLLEREGYVEISRTFGQGFESFEAKATALLIRDVEGYGAAQGDVESEVDFIARLKASPGLAPDFASVSAERHRYQAAQTADEVASVFRAVMPVLEGAVRRLLRAHGSEREHGTLGPMIRDLRERSIGTRGLRSQLNAVLNNGRDISLHGEDLPVAVLRIVCESSFELFPQLGLLFPDDN